MIQKRNLKNHLRDLSFKMTVDTEKYLEFVKGVTSDASLDYAMMATRFAELEANGTNTSQLMTAALGLTAESGEFTEVVKKIVFQTVNKFHVNDVVVYKLLPVTPIKIFEGIELTVIKFLLPKFYLSNVVQSV